MRRDRHDLRVGALHLAHLRREGRVGEQPFALAEHLEAVGGGLVLHHPEGRVRVREVLLDAAPDRLQVRVLGLEPGEQRLVHLEFARHVAERPFGDLGEPALGGDVGDDRELQAGVGGIARLLLQDAEQRLRDVRAGRARPPRTRRSTRCGATTEMPSSALQRSSRNSIASLALLPSPSVTPPALLICSAAAFMAASLLMPKIRTMPDLAPKPVILTVRSCAEAGVEKASAIVPSAANAAVRISMVSSLVERFRKTKARLFAAGSWSHHMKLNTFPPPEYHRGKMSGRMQRWPSATSGRGEARVRRPSPAAHAAKPASRPSRKGRDKTSGCRQACQWRPVRRAQAQRGQFRSPDADRVPGADGRDPSGSRRGRARRAALDLQPAAGAGAAARLGAGAPRRASGRHRVGDAAERAGDARGAFRRADGRRGAQRHQHAARCRDRRLHPGARRGEGADHRSRIRRAGRPGARPHEEAAAGHRRRRPALHRPGRAARQDRVRGVHRDGRSGLRRQAGDRRVERDRAQLHLGHHRQSEGRRLPSPRHVPGGGRQHHGVAAAAEAGVSVDPADVPLQRLVLPVVGHRDGRHACLPAQGRSGADLSDDRRARRDAHVRRADRAQHAGQRAGGAAPPLQPHRRHPDRRLAAARQGHQGRWRSSASA